MSAEEEQDTEEGAEMLELKNIKKSYLSGVNKVNALDDVSVNFRDNEFVAILGPSGSGKTTLLNIIGGLDRYDSGDLVINSRSTKQYADKDWDGYRNHSIGFVFQNYNLIPHQNVLSNVELALTLSGVSKKERRRKAKSVLRKVGLADQLHKKPNQLSGGQMQRVAIARALVNNPDILLADEPTGALDSKTSVQIMELIREISKDRLVIMVTHNPKIAKEYASRIIRIKDGKIRKDSDPFDPEMYKEFAPAPKKSMPSGKKHKAPKASMSLSTALSLSFNNLLTKKGRTLITSFAGSIGIIGIALILSLSNGMQAYIDSIERSALTSYPITIENENFDLTQILGSVGTSGQNIAEHGTDKIYKRPMLQNSVADFEMKMQQNDLGRFKAFIEMNSEVFDPLCSDIKYGYDIDLQIFKSDTTGGVSRLRPNDALEDLGLTTKTDIWEEIIGDSQMLNSQYELLAGNWPKNSNELVLFLDNNNELDDVALYALGLADVSELEQQAKSSATEEQSDEPIVLESYDYEEFLGLSFKVLPATAYYQKSSGKWNDMSENEAFMKKAVDSAQEIKIVAIARPKITAQSTVSTGVVGYMSGLTEYVINAANNSEIVKEQKANRNVDVFSGLKFKNTSVATASPTSSLVSMPPVEFAAKVDSAPEVTYVENSFGDFDVMTEDEIYAYIDENYKGEDRDTMKEFTGLLLKDILTASDKKTLTAYLDRVLEGSDMNSDTFLKYLKVMSKDMKLQLISAILISAKNQTSIDIPDKGELQSGNSSSSSKPIKDKEKFSTSTYEENLRKLGAADSGTPSSISLYPKDLDSKESLTKIIDRYNAKHLKDGNEENTISYTDYVNLVMSSVTQVIDMVTYALIAFVAISLVVSSIMIGIITYISVLERTKEIGVLRSIGASKKDISRVFNSETIIVGLTSGVIGVLMTVLLNIPINLIVKALAGIPKLASLPFFGAIALVAISVGLTLVAGFIPAFVAAKKDPVKALRSE